jgi:hypothetical protein
MSPQQAKCIYKAQLCCSTEQFLRNQSIKFALNGLYRAHQKPAKHESCLFFKHVTNFFKPSACDLNAHYTNCSKYLFVT